MYAFITAFPDAAGEYKDTLRIAVQHNPKVLKLGVQCKAVQPVANYEVPVCVPELLPYQNKQSDILDLAMRLSGAVMDSKAKKSTAKDKKAAGE